MKHNNRKLIVLTGPTGAGLNDVAADLLEQCSTLATVLPITARKMKEGETNGVGFLFFDLDGWNELKAEGDLLEATELAGNDYGTSRKLVNEKLAEGYHVLLTVEPERAAQIKRHMPEAIVIYVEPANPEQLRARYAETARNSFELTARMELAREQREQSGFCDKRIDSADLTEAVATLKQMIEAL